MHPFLRNVVIGLVGLILAGGLAALALFERDSGLATLALLAAALLTTVIGAFLVAQAWIWSGRAASMGHAGRSVAIATGGALAALMAAGAFAGVVILVLLFYLG